MKSKPTTSRRAASAGSNNGNNDAASAAAGPASEQEHRRYSSLLSSSSSSPSDARETTVAKTVLPSSSPLSRWLLPSSALASFLVQIALIAQITAVVHGVPLPYDVARNQLPSTVTYKAAVLTNSLVTARPLAYYANASAETNDDDQDGSGNSSTINSLLFPEFGGFQPDLLREIVSIAKELDNITVTFELDEAPLFTGVGYSYTALFNRIANDCNNTLTSTTLVDECYNYDLMIGDFYPFPSRSLRATFTPPILTSGAGTLQYVYRTHRQVTTLAEAQVLNQSVCLLKNSWFDETTLKRFPQLHDLRCFSHDDCIANLKNESCALFVDDDLQLKYLVTQDSELRMAPEIYDESYIAWPFSATIDLMREQLFTRWMYEAKIRGRLDILYDKYFRVEYCPIGKAGEDCTRECSPTNGLSNRDGQCICDSTRWTGDDCLTEVLEEMNFINASLKTICYIMAICNFCLVIICALWLLLYRQTAQVQFAQPLFLILVLIGCCISTSTIFALGQDGNDHGRDHSNDPKCMLIPWLYSVGFSVTFGTLFAKIRRVWKLFVAAAHMQRTQVSAQMTFRIVGIILSVDVGILLIWTFVDPLYWTREDVFQDQYGHTLESEGHCTSEHWKVFAALIALFHFSLMAVACYMCYVSRDIPTEFSEGKWLSIAMISNMQIFVVGLPILILIGSDAQTGFFVRSVIVWMNDLVIVVLIFGNLMYSFHYGEDCNGGGPETSNLGGSIRSVSSTASRRKSRRTMVRQAVKSFKRRTEQRESNFHPSSIVRQTQRQESDASISKPKEDNDNCINEAESETSTTHRDLASSFSHRLQSTMDHVPEDQVAIVASDVGSAQASDENNCEVAMTNPGKKDGDDTMESSVSAESDNSNKNRNSGNSSIKNEDNGRKDQEFRHR